MENEYFVDSDKLSESALKRKHQLETDPSSRTDCMEYMEGQQIINSDIREKVLSEMNSYQPEKYTTEQVLRALRKDSSLPVSVIPEYRK